MDVTLVTLSHRTRIIALICVGVSLSLSFAVMPVVEALSRNGGPETQVILTGASAASVAAALDPTKVIATKHINMVSYLPLFRLNLYTRSYSHTHTCVL